MDIAPVEMIPTQLVVTVSGVLISGLVSWLSAWFTLKGRVSKVEHEVEESTRLAKAAHRRLDNYDRAAVDTALELREFRIRMEVVSGTMVTMEKKIDHLITKGCAVGCRRDDDGRRQ